MNTGACVAAAVSLYHLASSGSRDNRPRDTARDLHELGHALGRNQALSPTDVATIRRMYPKSSTERNPMNTVTLAQLPSLVLPLLQFVVAALPPGMPPSVTFVVDTTMRILQMFATQPAQQLKHGPNHPLAMPAHLPELPPEDQWTPDGIRAWAERHAS